MAAVSKLLIQFNTLNNWHICCFTPVGEDFYHQTGKKQNTNLPVLFTNREEYMQYELQQNETECIISIKGDFDSETAKEARDLFEDFIANDVRDFTIDFNKIFFLDSSGIGAIVFLYKRLRAQKRLLVIRNVWGQPQSLLEILRIGNSIPVMPRSLVDNYYEENGEKFSA